MRHCYLSQSYTRPILPRMPPSFWSSFSFASDGMENLGRKSLFIWELFSFMSRLSLCSLLNPERFNWASSWSSRKARLFLCANSDCDWWLSASLTSRWFSKSEIKGTTTDNSVCSNNIILNRLLLVVASALVPLFYGFDRARMQTCVFNYIWWFIFLSCCVDIRYDLFCCSIQTHLGACQRRDGPLSCLAEAEPRRCRRWALSSPAVLHSSSLSLTEAEGRAVIRVSMVILDFIRFAL